MLSFPHPGESTAQARHGDWLSGKGVACHLASGKGSPGADDDGTHYHQYPARHHQRSGADSCTACVLPVEGVVRRSWQTLQAATSRQAQIGACSPGVELLELILPGQALRADQPSSHRKRDPPSSQARTDRCSPTLSYQTPEKGSATGRKSTGSPRPEEAAPEHTDPPLAS